VALQGPRLIATAASLMSGSELVLIRHFLEVPLQRACEARQAGTSAALCQRVRSTGFRRLAQETKIRFAVGLGLLSAFRHRNQRLGSAFCRGLLLDG
jgi:hypothetical protein